MVWSALVVLDASGTCQREPGPCHGQIIECRGETVLCKERRIVLCSRAATPAGA